MKKLTGVLLIETGVVNRGDGFGNIASVKKVSTTDGLKVFFSAVSYKRALWNSLEKHRGWQNPLVTREGGVVQRTGTIMDSEEFDFGGTMVATPKYERSCTFLVDNGISINNYTGVYDEFMTNAAIAKLYGNYETNIINKENFYGIYILPVALELDRVGFQQITEIDTKIEEKDSLSERMKKIYKSLPIEDKDIKEIESNIEVLVKKVDSIEYNNKITTITLKKEERMKRIKDLIYSIGELDRRIEGSGRNLTPFFSAFSLDYAAPRYLLFIKDKLKKKEELTPEIIEDFGKKEKRIIKCATIENYISVADELINMIEKKL